VQQRTFGKRNATKRTTNSTNRTKSAADQIGPPSRSPHLIASMAFLGAFGAGVFMWMGSSTGISTPTAGPPEGTVWVTSQRLARHSCPSATCGVVGEFYYRGGVQPLETRDGWVRVSKYYDASCTNGRSDYVETGNAQCAQSNGIVDGQFAEWVPETRVGTHTID